MIRYGYETDFVKKVVKQIVSEGEANIVLSPLDGGGDMQLKDSIDAVVDKKGCLRGTELCGEKAMAYDGDAFRGPTDHGIKVTEDMSRLSGRPQQRNLRGQRDR